jgi:hypothetical protein
LILFVMGSVPSCAKDPPPVAPGPPIPADPPVALKSMTEECDAMLAALGAFRACPNMDKDDQGDVDAWIQRAQIDFAAGRKVTLDADAQSAIAQTCRRATGSVTAAIERCHNGRKPRED